MKGTFFFFVWEKHPHIFCNLEVSFNLAVQNFSKVDAMHPYAAFGSVCKTEKWQNYTKALGFPEGCRASWTSKMVEERENVDL